MKFLLFRAHLSRPYQRLAFIAHAPWPGDGQEGHRLLRGVFNFDGEEVEKSGPLFWRHPGLSSSFLENLHSFSWLRSLKATTAIEAREVARQYIAEWMRTQHSWNPFVWSPSVTGRRLASWIALYDFFGSSADDDFLWEFQRSLSRQVRYLKWLCSLLPDPQLDLPTLKGLILSQLICSNALDRALARLDIFLDLHLNTDGSFKSRSPVAQLHTLKDLLEIRLFLREAQQPISPTLQGAIERLTHILRFFRLGDGKLSVFFDSKEGTAALIDMVLSQADVRNKRLAYLPDAGFYRLTAGPSILLFDAGSSVNSQFLNQDRLGLEFSYGDKRILVNGTRPHILTDAIQQATATTQVSGTALFFDKTNTLLNEDLFAPQPQWHNWQRDEDGNALIMAEWKQLIKQSVLSHQRTLFLGASGVDLRGEDIVSGPTGGTILLRFTFHPTIKTFLHPGSSSITLQLPNGHRWRFTASRNCTASLHEGYYYGDNNREQQASQILLKGPLTEEPLTIKWNLRLSEQ